MKRRSKSTLFLMEQLIVVAVFAICAAACVRILTASYFMATEARDVSNAIRAAESGAECYKAISGDVAKVAEIMGGSTASLDGASAAIVYYDEEWRVCGEDYAAFKLCLVGGNPEAGSGAALPGELSVEKLSGEVIIAFAIAARGA